MLTREEATARVARGAAHLDQVRPGWFTRIDVGTLTLHDPCGCIVGQLCGGSQRFSAGLELLGIGRSCEEAWMLGFDLSHEEIYVVVHQGQRRAEAYQPLQDAWIQAIADRLHPIQEASVEAPVEVG